MMAFDVEVIRKDFPILKRKMNGKTLAYLDNAATTQKPHSVLDAMNDYYKERNANIHRGAYTLSQESTDAYETARKNVASFIGAKPEEIIFTKNATEALNLVANVTCEAAPRGSSVLLTQMEHHSNIVPWQLNAKKNSQRLKYVKVRSNGTLCNEDVDEFLAASPHIFSFTHVSNVLGTINDAKTFCRKAKKAGALACVDAAQSVPHMKVNVKEMDCDFLAFSGHKMLGPTGIGVLYMKKELQMRLPPFLGGGDMIKQVSFEQSTWNDPPYKYEAGTQNVAGAVGLSAAVDYLRGVGLQNIAAHEKKLAQVCRKELSSIKGVKFYGPKNGSGIISFNVGKIHAHDAGEFANRDGIAIRAGHHCAMPLMKLLDVPATCRASFYLYNTEEEVERLATAMKKAQRALG
ncbi:MAG: cysteine desulfurase [Candidatus Micrarchaeota archaeon]|nr:cysteine desulfurase [Candidatus Micrarchaeota archaeon]